MVNHPPPALNGNNLCGIQPREVDKEEYLTSIAYFFDMAYGVFFVWYYGADKPRFVEGQVETNLEVISPWQNKRAKNSECFFRNAARL